MLEADRDVRITRLQDQGKDDFLESTTPEQRVGMMWQLAVDAWAFMGEKIEPESPRHVVRVVRRQDLQSKLD